MEGEALEHDMNASAPMSRRATRVLIASFVAFAVAVFALPEAPFGTAQAQTASPTPASTGARIQFLNPSGTTGSSGPGREVSAKNDGTDSQYHLVAWVGSMPSNPTVEFKYQSGNDPEITIGQGTLRGTDTFDAFWSLGTLADGTYSVKAILFSNGVEVNRDSETVEVNNTTAEPAAGNPGGLKTTEDQGQTVEIVYPPNASGMGFFRQPGTGTPFAGSIDVTLSTGGTGIEGRAYFTTTPPGNEPQWTSCSGAETAANAADGIRCTLPAGTTPESVTAVSVAAEDDDQRVAANPPNPTNGPDSGDAHRSPGYTQSPSTVTLSPATQRKDDADPAAGNQYDCAEVTATLVDQFGRKVVGANMDVHAAGPTDNLFYDSTAGSPARTHPSKAPDRAHGATESTVNCEATANPRPFVTDSLQAEHEVSGEGDIKHVESAAQGTNDGGQFKFALYNLSTTITGVTQFATWYDGNDDDLRCESEPTGNGSIGWSADPAGPTGFPAENTVCPEPTSTASPTASASASRSATGSPSPSRSPSGSRTVTLITSQAQVTFGTPVTLSGQVFSSIDSCEDGEFIRIRRRVHGQTEFGDLTSTTTDASGAFSLEITPTANADYQAVATAHDNCQEASSSAVSVLVKVTITGRANDATPERGTRVVIKGKVSPNHSGTRVVLQRRKGGRWVKVDGEKLNSRSVYNFAFSAGWRRSRTFRVKWPSLDSDHEANQTSGIKVTTHR